VSLILWGNGHQIVTQGEFEKSSAYGRDKMSFGFITDAFETIKTLLTLHFFLMPWFWDQSGLALVYFGYSADASNEIVHSLVFLLGQSLVDTAIGIPFSLYSTFVIEERHGFNKQVLTPVTGQDAVRRPV